MGKIPDRWLPYRALGKVIKGTRFLAFKVPLNENLSKRLPASARFTPDILIASCPKLSLVIDLTNTHRYYNKREFTLKSVRHEKIYVPGRECPRLDLVLRFFELVDKFLESENNTGGLIGVHCTHGVNRTGYFICRYMIERLGFEPSAAIQAFQEGRGYPIERQNYINDLKKCVRKGAVSIQEGNVNANSTYKSKGKPDLYMSTNTYSLHKRAEDLIKTIKANSSHWRANTDGLYRSVEPNSSYRGSNSNTLRKSKDNHATARSNGKEFKNNRNKKEKKNREYTSSYNRGHAKPESNCWRHDNSNYNFNSQGERNYGHTSTNSKHVKGSGSTCKGSRTNSNYSRKADTNQRDQSDDWRANNPYAQRNFGGHVHTNFNVG